MLNSTIPPTTKLPPFLLQFLPQLIRLLLPQQIFAVRYPGSRYTILLLILPDSTATPCEEQEKLVLPMCARYPQVHISLYKTSAMRHRLLNGHPFYSRACTPAHLVYNTGAEELPVTSAERLAAVEAYAKLIFCIHLSKATCFLQSARAALSAKDHSHTLFMLHQCAELALKAVIIAFTGQQVKTHSIPNLLQYVRRFASVLQVFNAGNTNNIRLLQLLNSAYNEARYNVAFTVSAADTKALMKKVELLHRLAEQLFV